jgi:hypothetical protein
MPGSYFIMNHPWPRLFHDYDILEGRVWILFLIWIAVAPYVMYRIDSK